MSKTSDLTLALEQAVRQMLRLTQSTTDSGMAALVRVDRPLTRVISLGLNDIGNGDFPVALDELGGALRDLRLYVRNDAAEKLVLARWLCDAAVMPLQRVPCPCRSTAHERLGRRRRATPRPSGPTAPTPARHRHCSWSSWP